VLGRVRGACAGSVCRGHLWGAFAGGVCRECVRGVCAGSVDGAAIPVLKRSRIDFRDF
jgi:hypothetical protein